VSLEIFANILLSDGAQHRCARWKSSRRQARADAHAIDLAEILEARPRVELGWTDLQSVA